MIISTEEAATMLNVSRTRILKLIKEGRIKAKKRKGIIGWLIDDKEILLFEKKPIGRPKKNKRLRYRN